MKKGFTLIELLVVVLIIGILSAIALPQYNKAVLRARLAEVPIRVKAMRDALDLYVLENGYPSSGTVSLLDVSPDLGAGLTIDGSWVKSKYWQSSPFCDSSGCHITTWFYLKGISNSTINDQFVYLNHKYKGDTKWTTDCVYSASNNMAGYLCTQLGPDSMEDEL